MGRWASVWVVVMLSGCAGGADETKPVDVAEPGAFDETTGAIEGLVHDDSLEPLADVEVGIAGLPSVLSDAKGRYAIGHVPPGDHPLFAHKPGYTQTASRVLVTAGERTRIDIQLSTKPFDGPTQTTVIRQGFIPCSAVWRPRVVTSGFSGGCPALGGEDIITRVPMGGPWDELATIVGETAWRSNQAFGAGLMMGWGAGAKDDSCGVGLGQVQGRSPLRLAWSVQQLADARANLTKECGGSDPCLDPEACDFTSIGFSSPDTLGPSSAVDVGVTISQAFTTYVTQFRLAPAPANFTALPDG